MSERSGSKNVVVLGGGAAGFFAAIACAEADPSARVTILERTSGVLGKVKISGGGRCNVTHACFDPAQLVTYYPRGSKALRGPFSRFQPRDTIAWFEERGVPLKTERDNRVFPVSDSSQSIIDCLTGTAEKAGIQVRRQVLVSRIEHSASVFRVVADSEETVEADRLILATGSSPQGWEWAQALGHTIETPVPSLFTFTIKDPRLEGLAGVSVPNARIQIAGAKQEQTGPLLITHWGLSGPAVLKLSAWAARDFHQSGYQAELCVSWIGDMKAEPVFEALKRFRTEKSRRVAGAGGPYDLPRRLWTKLVGAAGFSVEQIWSDVSNAQLQALVQELRNGRYRMTGQSTFKEEFVTCGGIRLDEVDFRTLESKRCPGLYFAGEVLDIDGVTGGFNFQNAWTTGWIAGRSAASVQAPA